MQDPKYQYGVKKESIKKRTITIYLPTIAKVDAWKAVAKAAKMTLSKFVQEHVDNSLRDEYSPGTASRRKLQQKIEQLVGELKSAENQIRRFDTLEEKLDRVLRNRHTERYSEIKFVGDRRFDRELIDQFKRRGFISFTDVLGLLKVMPNEVEVVKGIDEQLNVLDHHGLIERESTGWRWRC